MLEEIKIILGIADNALDSQLNIIIANTKARLKMLLGGLDVPENLNYVVTEVSVKRFNRIGSEGITSHTVEGESMSFSDDDFAEFAGDIQAYLDSVAAAKKGKVLFL